MEKNRRLIINKLDKLWRDAVNSVGSCDYCGSSSRKLNAHHIVTRSVSALRWKMLNGICLCSYHHSLSSDFSAHKTPLEFHAFLEKKYPGRYDKLMIMKRNKIGTKDFQLKAIYQNFEYFSS